MISDHEGDLALKRFGFGEHLYELVEGWPKAKIQGAATDVCVDSDGRVYVAVRNPMPDGSVGNILGGSGHVLVLDQEGVEVGNWGDIASSPHGIWISESDEVFLADTGSHTVTKYTTKGDVLLTLGTPYRAGEPGHPFYMPTHAIEIPGGDIVVTDGYGQNFVHRFSASGQLLLTFGGGDSVFLESRFGGDARGVPGTAPGQFNVPHDLVANEESAIYVMDRGNDRWQVFSPDGELLRVQEGVLHPNRVMTDQDGNLLIAGGLGIEVWTQEGVMLGSWGELGDEPGQFVKGYVHGAWLAGDGSLYTAEASVLNRLQKFVRV